MLFSVIPVKTGIQSRSERDSSSTILSGLPLPAFARTGFAGETTFYEAKNLYEVCNLIFAFGIEG